MTTKTTEFKKARTDELNLSWSLCHEYPVAWEYCRPMIEKAPEYGVKRLEIAGVAQSDVGNIDAYVRFKSHPAIRKTCDQQLISNNIANLRKICQQAHQLGLEVDIWHREVSFPQAFLETEKGILNEDGDIDFNGPYLDLIHAKINEFFENVPEIDGLVLTLTEAMFPIIHVANKEKNPPTRNITNVMNVFKRACEQNNKRFVIRPFAALAEDYAYLKEVILDMNRKSDFFVEIKVQPSDWHPFLPMNPVIEDLSETKRIIEMELVGEYYGAGFVPVCFPEQVKRQIKYIKSKDIKCVAGRVERLGIRAMDIANDVNVFAMTACWNNPDADIDQVYNDWAKSKWDDETARHIIPILKRTFDIVKKTFYLDQHLQSHCQFPDFEMLKWARFFGYFKEGEPLSRTEDEWGIISNRISPTWEQIIAEKDQAIREIQNCLDDVEKARSSISKDAYEYLIDGFAKFMAIAKAFRQLCSLTIAYLKVIHSDGADRDKFVAEKESTVALAREIEHSFGPGFFGSTPKMLADHSAQSVGTLLAGIAEQMACELDIELAIQTSSDNDPLIVDWVLCGGISDEWRVRKQTHSSWAHRENDIIHRLAGNRIMADGFFEYDLKAPAGPSLLCLLWGYNGEKRQGYLDIDGKRQVIKAGGKNGFDWVEIPMCFEEEKVVPIRITKMGKLSPMVSQMKVCLSK